MVTSLQLKISPLNRRSQAFLQKYMTQISFPRSKVGYGGLLGWQEYQRSSPYHNFSSDKAAAEALAEKVEEASKVLAEYNKCLDSEIKERQELQELLAAFIWQQKKLLKEAKKNLKDFQSKQEKVTAVKEELKSHLANLPDLSKLPMGSKSSLTPLPSVGDLFT